MEEGDVDGDGAGTFAIRLAEHRVAGAKLRPVIGSTFRPVFANAGRLPTAPVRRWLALHDSN